MTLLVFAKVVQGIRLSLISGFNEAIVGLGNPFSDVVKPFKTISNSTESDGIEQVQVEFQSAQRCAIVLKISQRLKRLEFID